METVPAHPVPGIPLLGHRVTESSCGDRLIECRVEHRRLRQIRLHKLEDIGALTGGAVYSRHSGFTLETMTAQQLGRARRVRARQAAASQPDDPTRLAYTVYGDPRATVSQRP